jgi:ABC-type amino acid transport substrate-binding protein
MLAYAGSRSGAHRHVRATFLGNNPVQGSVDPKTDAISGPVADIVKELAHRAGVPYTITPAVGAKEVIERLNNHTADIGFLAWEAERARQVDFSVPYSLMGSTYLTPAAVVFAIAKRDNAALLNANENSA